MFQHHQFWLSKEDAPTSVRKLNKLKNKERDNKLHAISEDGVAEALKVAGFLIHCHVQ